MEPHTPDEVLILACARGDATSLAKLYDRHGPVVLAVAKRIMRSKADAEDVVHSVFIEAWAHATEYDSSRGSVRSWLLMRARSRAVDALRKWSSRVDGAPEERAGVPPNYVDRLAVRHAIGRLPREMQAVIDLSFVEGLTSSEISVRLSIPIGTVKSRLARALTRLRVDLEV
jgi:RNA polymerase sigma-70 factor, ECF subfamily